MGDTSQYGKLYWCVKTVSSGTVRLHADEATVEHGALVLRSHKDEHWHTRFAVGPGEWRYCYAASVLDGGAVAVEHWDEHKPAAKATKAPPTPKRGTSKR
jgi:hypothetical protein